METERPLILYQVVEVETIKDGVTGEVQNYISARRTFSDEEQAKQERKELLQAERQAPEEPDRKWEQLDYRVSVDELKVSPRTIEEADKMDKERYDSMQNAVDAVMSGLLMSNDSARSPQEDDP